jgi:hypothetical protein
MFDDRSWAQIRFAADAGTIGRATMEAQGGIRS